jgi:phenylalanyl-tRNA synthetase beta chain
VEFDELCFEFGIELDEITSEKEMFENEQNKKKEGLSEDILYKIEVAANRYDLLCVEGLALALRTFLNLEEFPKFEIKNVQNPINELHVESTVNEVRPHCCAAILRNIKFTQESLIGFMELQDKLHQNICKARTLVSMGTHDLDTVSGPFKYAGLKPESFKFVPLNRTEACNGNELLDLLSNDAKLKQYVHLLKNEPLFPAIVDSQGRIMSVPPLINSDHSKIRVETKNVFIEVTAKDSHKANIVLNTLIAMFSVYCIDKFTVEEVVIVNPNGDKVVYPNLQFKTFNTDIEYLNRIAGTDLKIETISKLLNRMELITSIKDEKNLTVTAPITRSDILHPCDIVEDLAISYGYNNIAKVQPKTICNGSQQPINKLSDLIRLEMALSGYTECLTTVLLSKQDLFTNMLQEINEETLSTCVQILLSKTSEFEVARNTLVPCILKTIEANKAHEVR